VCCGYAQQTFVDPGETLDVVINEHTLDSEMLDAVILFQIFQKM